MSERDVNPSRFSQLYQKGDTLTKDSVRMRKRVEKTIESDFSSEDSLKLGRLIEEECGIDIIEHGAWGSYSSWGTLFRNGELRDVLDTITFAVRFFSEGSVKASKLLKRMKRILEEENVGYFLDEFGVVHPKVDKAFEFVRRSLIAGIEGEKFAAAREHLEAVDNALLANPVDGRTAIRSVFDVIENIFKQSFVGETHINSASMRKRLKPRIEACFETDLQEQRVALKIFSGMENWVNSAHFYRHEAGKPLPSQPSSMTTLALVSQGYAFARWLLSVVEDSE